MGSDLNSYNGDTASAIQSAQSSRKSDGIRSASIHYVTLFFHKLSGVCHTNESKSYGKQLPGDAKTGKPFSFLCPLRPSVWSATHSATSATQQPYFCLQILANEPRENPPV